MRNFVPVGFELRATDRLWAYYGVVVLVRVLVVRIVPLVLITTAAAATTTTSTTTTTTTTTSFPLLPFCH